MACWYIDAMFILSPGDALLRPQLLKMLPFSLNRLTINLQPSLEKFESQLLQLINADCHNTVRPDFHNTHSLESPCTWHMTQGSNSLARELSNHAKSPYDILILWVYSLSLWIACVLKIDVLLRKINCRYMVYILVKQICLFKILYPCYPCFEYIWCAYKGK